MEELQKLYDLLTREGKYTKSFDEFKVKWNDSEYQSKVYDVVSRDGFYTKDKDSFLQKYSGGAVADGSGAVASKGGAVKLPLKKKEPTNMDLPLGDSSSVSPTQPQSDLNPFAKNMVGIPQGKPTNNLATQEPITVEVMTPNKKVDFLDNIKNVEAEAEAKKTRVFDKETEKKIAAGAEYKPENIENYYSKKLESGANQLSQIAAAIPESIYNVFSIPQNAVAWATGWDIATNSDNFKKTTGLSNPVLDMLKNEQSKISTQTTKFEKDNYSSTSVSENISNGNYQDAFELLGANVIESAPVSLAMMASAGTLSTAELAAAGSVAFYNQNAEQLREENPDMSEIELNMKALGMSSAEYVFGAIGTGTIGQVYKDIIKKEGLEVGKVIFKDGLVAAYKTALKKYGAAAALVGEGIEEGATQITQNLIAGKPPMEGVVDAFIVGVGSGATLGAPMTAVQATNRVNNIVKNYQAKSEINSILKDKDVDLHQVFDVPILNAITPEQVQIANTDRARDLLNKNLLAKIKSGDITEDDARQSLYVFDKVQQVSNSVKGLDINNDDKAKVANLLQERNQIQADIKNREDILVVKEKEEIARIEKEITDIILNSKPTENAIQEQSTDESVLLSEEPEVGLPKVGEGNTESEVTPARTEEKTLTEDEQKRKVNLEEALKNADKEQGVVTIGLESFPIAEAENELSKLNDKIANVEAVNNELKVIEDIFNEEFGIAPIEAENPVEAETPTQEVAPIEEASPVEAETPAEALPATQEVARTEGEITPIEEEITPEEDLTPDERVRRARIASSNKKLTQNTLKSLKSIFPDLKVHFFDTKAAAKRYFKSVRVVQATADRVRAVALFTSGGKPISIVAMNSRLQNTTLPHEVWHVLLSKAFQLNENKVRFQQFRDAIEKALIESGNKALLKDISAFSDQEYYKSRGESNEEFLVQLGAYLTITGFKVGELSAEEKTLLNHIKDIINKFAIQIFNKPIFLADATPDNVLSFLIEMSDSMRRGEDMSKYFEEGKAPISERRRGNSLRSNKAQVNNTNKGIGLAKKMGMNDKGFFNKNSNPSQLNNMLRQYGYSVKQAKTSADGFGGGYFLVDEQGRKVINTLNYKSQIDAYHGSSKNFDKFSTSKIGEGVGSQAQGWGLYFTDLKSIAKFYAKNNNIYEVSLHEGKSPSEYTWLEWNKPIEKNVRDRILEKFIQEKNIPKNVLDKIAKALEEDIDGADFYDLFKELGVTAQDGFVISALLDNKYVSNGLQIYDYLKKSFNNIDSDASKFLLRANVDGVRYQNKNESENGFDYVVFDENAVTIKNVLKGQVSKGQASETNKAIKVVERARAQGISEAKIKEFLESKGVSADDIEAAMSPDTEASSRITLTEDTLPGIDKLMAKVDSLIATAKKNGLSKKEQLAEVLKKIEKSPVYKNATDVQREKIIRDIQKVIGIRQKSAPSVDVILGGIKNTKKITLTEKQLLIEQIKNKARGAKDAIVAWKKASVELTKNISELVKSGVITAKQASVILKKFSKVNIFSTKSVSRFVDYMAKAFADADYSNQISTANKLRGEIKKLSRDKNRNADLKVLAKSFSEVDPALVEDIYKYNKIAAEIKESISGSKLKGERVNIAEMVNIDEASDYINTEMKKQEKLLLEEKASEIRDLMDIDTEGMTIEELNMIMEGDEKIDKYKESIVRDIVKKAFDVYSNVIEEMLKTGYDAFYTGEKLSLSKSDIELIKKFMDMDLSVLTPKEGLRAVDALTNFIQNNSIANMNTVLADYTGRVNAAKVKEKGISAQPLQKYWSTTLGKALGEYTTNLNILFERMFKGFNKGGIVKDSMGLTNLVNQKSMAQTESNRIVNDYVTEFYKKTANGEVFNSEYNDVERGLSAFMLRSVMGTKAEMKEDFDRRKTLIEESIDALSKGDDLEKKKAVLYKKAYDKILKDAKNTNDIKGKVDKTNMEAISFWQQQWADKYDDLADVSSSVYNKILERDINYTPDKFSKISTETGVVDFDKFESAFHNNNGTLYKNETGVLMAAVKPTTLPKNPKNGDVVSYINLSFDKNNSNSMYDALIDMKTAAPIRQIESFLNSKDFKDIVPTSDAKMLKGRIDLYVRNIRNKSVYSNDELSNMIRRINKIATMGVAQALGGLTQPIKQVVPVAMNTIMNAGSIDIMSVFNTDKNNFMSNSGRSIANRGVESQAQIESINKLIEQASKSNAEKALSLIEKANRMWLEAFLVKPDVFIARASWMTYYEKSLKQQGIDANNIDYNSHELNEEAADYAQRMVDRQQNVSDSDLSGKLFVNKSEIVQVMVKTLMPFASFRMNQASRLGADMAVLTDKTSTDEDKKIAAASLSGFAVELVTFKIISAGIALLLGSLTKWIMDKDEDEEEFNKRFKSVVKGQVTGTITDIISPVPFADKGVQMLMKPTMDMIAEKTGLPLDIYGPSKSDFISNMGTFGISLQRATQLYEVSKLAATGKYTDEYGKEHTISDEDKDFMKSMSGLSLLGNVGLAPSEVNNVVNNSVKYAKQKTKTPEEKAIAQKNLENKAKETMNKEEALQNTINSSTDQDIIDAANKKIDELYPSSEKKEELKKQRQIETLKKNALLVDPDTGEEYDNETELKRYNRPLWEQNFGPQSDWYKEHEAEDKLNKLLTKETRVLEDKEYGYTPIKKSRKNSDGSTKRGIK